MAEARKQPWALCPHISSSVWGTGGRAVPGGRPLLASFSVEIRLFSSFVHCPPYVTLSSPHPPGRCLGGLPSLFVWCKLLTAPLSPGESPSLQWGHRSGAAQPPGRCTSIFAVAKKRDLKSAHGIDSFSNAPGLPEQAGLVDRFPVGHQGLSGVESDAAGGFALLASV